MLRFLCLHPAFSNAEVFAASMQNFIADLEKEGLATFFYPQAPIEVELPDFMFADAWIPPPFLRWFSFDYEEGLNMISIEKHMRTGLEAIRNAVRDHGPFDGIIGHSEGASAAAQIIYGDIQEGKQPPFRCAIFINGSSPIVEPKAVNGEQHSGAIEADADAGNWQALDVKSLHLVGTRDGISLKALDLYRLFDENHATLYDHGQGHFLSRDAKIAGRISRVIRQFIEEVEREES